MKNNTFIFLVMLCLFIRPHSAPAMEIDNLQSLIIGLYTHNRADESVERIKKLADQGLDLNNSKQSLNPLFHSINSGKSELALYLLDKGANPTIILEPDNQSILDILEDQLSTYTLPARMDPILRKIHFTQKAIENYRKKNGK